MNKTVFLIFTFVSTLFSINHCLCTQRALSRATRMIVGRVTQRTIQLTRRPQHPLFSQTPIKQFSSLHSTNEREYTADLLSKNDKSKFFDALRKNNKAQMEVIYQDGHIDLNNCFFGNSVLFMASCPSVSYEIFEWLIREKNANIHATTQDYRKKSLLHDLVIWDCGKHTNEHTLKKIKLLLSLGVDPDLKNDEGNTPAHAAASRDGQTNWLALELLIPVTDTSITNNRGSTIFSLLSQNQGVSRYFIYCQNLYSHPKAAMIRWFEKQGLNYNEQNEAGNTLAHLVLKKIDNRCGAIAMNPPMQSLIEKTNISIRNQKGETLFDIATERGLGEEFIDLIRRIKYHRN